MSNGQAAEIQNAPPSPDRARLHTHAHVGFIWFTPPKPAGTYAQRAHRRVPVLAYPREWDQKRYLKMILMESAITAHPDCSIVVKISLRVALRSSGLPASPPV